MKRLYFILISLFITSVTYAGTISGTVTNLNENTIIKNVNINLSNRRTGTTTNTDGFYSFKNLTAGHYEITFSHIGFRTETRTVDIGENQSIILDITLEPIAVPLNEIVVTSTRYEKQLKDVSAPFTVVRKEKIEQTVPQDAARVLSSEPGISLARDGIWGTHVNIRGLSRSNIVMLVDGNRIDTATDLAAGLSMVDVNDIERIEVLKGAASSLYGTGAVGGVVNIITQQPWFDDTPYLKVNLAGEYGSVNHGGNGHFLVQSGASNWYVSLSGMTRKAQNTRTPEGEIPNSQFQDENISAKAGVRLLQNQEINLNYQRFYAQDVGIPGGYPLFPDIAHVTYPEEKREMISVQYIIRNVSPLISKISFKYFNQNILRDVENIPGQVKNVPAVNGQPAKRINVLSVTPRATHKTNGVQLQTDWILFKNQHVIAGMDAWQKDLDSRREKNLRIDVLSPADGSVKSVINQVIGERPLPVAYYRSIGIYLQDEFNIRKKLTVTVGGRYDRIDVENEKTLNPIYQITNGVRDDSPATQTILWEKNKSHDYSWSGNLGILYRINKNYDLTLSLGKSFRSPFIEERFQYIDLGNVVKIGDPHLRPEQGLFSDLGLKIRSGDFTFTGNVFYNQLKDLVIETPTTFEGRDALINSNVGKAVLYGSDLGTMFKISGKLQVYANAGYVNGQDTYNNVPLPLIAPLNGKLGVAGNLYKFFNYDLSVTFFAQQNRIADWEFKTPGYAYIDFYLSTIPLKLLSFNSQLIMGIENLTDRAYRNHLSTNRGNVTIEPGRNIKLRWKISY
ncbi:TonB-dependent receptor [candidate division KSB1 bacterium]|nr:TonB-dependent receptor [candidate division KSB1 bacterium]